MGFSFARLKNWLGYENITNTDLNSEFNNIISKAGSDTLSSANSTNGTAPTVPAMQAMLSPGGVGTEVLAMTTQQDIQQIRYQLDSIIGDAQWYSNPASNIATLTSDLNALNSLPESRIVSGRVSALDQPMFLVPNGAAPTISLKATATNFQAFFNDSLVTFSNDISLTSLATAPAANNTCTVNDAALTGTQATKIQGERGTSITVNSMGTSISALVGTYAAFKISTEYFIAKVTSTTSLDHAFRGVAFDSTDAWLPRVAVSNGDTITLMKLTWVFATYTSSTPALSITYNRPTVAYAQPSGPAIGDYWYDLGNSTWKTYNGSIFVTVIANFVGICIQNTSNCVAARSADFSKNYSILNTVEVEFDGVSSIRASRMGTKVHVYGINYDFQNTIPIWDPSVNPDTGTTLAANTKYACYVTNRGDIKISNIYPTERKFDLLGGYHPEKPWRCVGEYTSDAFSAVDQTTISSTNHHQFVLPNQFVSSAQIVNNTITASQLATGIISNAQVSNSAAISRSKIAPVSVTVSASSGTGFSTSSTTATAVPNLTCTLSVLGGPVMLLLQGDGTTGIVNSSCIYLTTSGGIPDGVVQILRDATILAEVQLDTGASATPRFPPGMVSFIDTGATAGAHTWSIKVYVANAAYTIGVLSTVLAVYEIN